MVQKKNNLQLVPSHLLIFLAYYIEDTTSSLQIVGNFLQLATKKVIPVIDYPPS